MTWLKFVNKFICQWFFIRLTKHLNFDTKEIRYSIQYWIVPTTGWNTNFKYIGKNSPKFFYLSK